MGSNFIRDAVVIAFTANETISIIENAGLMGVPIPAVITRAIEVLKNKADKNEPKNGSHRTGVYQIPPKLQLYR